MAQTKTRESQTQAEILKYLGNRRDVRCWRNNTGRIADRKGRVVSFGLVGSADIIGIRLLRAHFPTDLPLFPLPRGFDVSHDYFLGLNEGRRYTMSKLGQFLAVEVKSDTGRQSEAQRNFQQMVEAFGGLYILARRVDDLYPWFPPTA